MEILKKLTPAETKFLLEPGILNRGILLRLTYMDLLLRKVLKQEKIESQFQDYSIVSAGINLTSFQPNGLQQLFIQPFRQNPDLTLSIRDLMKMIKPNIKSAYDFKWTYLIPGPLKEHIKPRPKWALVDLFASISLTESGLALQQKIRDFLNAINLKIKQESLTAGELEQLKSVIGTNFILLEGYDSEYLKSLFEEVDQKNRKRNSEPDAPDTFDDYNYPTGTTFWSDWMMIDVLMHAGAFDADSSFDRNFDTFVIHLVMEAMIVMEMVALRIAMGVETVDVLAAVDVVEIRKFLNHPM